MAQARQPGNAPPKGEEFLNKGKKALADGEYDMAIQYFRQLFKIVEDREEVSQLLSQAELEKAKSQINIVTQPLYTFWTVLLVSILRMYKAGIKTARILAKSRPSSKLAANLYATCCFKTGKIGEAIQTYEVYLREKPFDEGILNKLSRIYYDRQDYPNAVRTLDALRRLRPDDPEISKMFDVAITQKYTSEGTDVKKLQRIDDERKKVEAKRPKIDEKKVNLLIEQCKQKPEDIGLRLRLGRMLKKGAQWDQAAGVFEAALELDGENLQILKELVEVYDQLEKAEQAAAILNQLAQLQPEDTQLRKEILDRKIAQGQQATEGRQESVSDEALEALQQERLDLEIDEYRQKIKDNPANPDLHLQMGKLLLQKDDLDEAIKSFQQVTRNPTRAFYGHKLLGETFYKKGIHEIAVEQFQKALERSITHRDFMSGDVKDIHYTLSQIHEDLGDLDKAIEYLQPVYEEDLNYRDVQERFEKLYEKRREVKKKDSEAPAGE